MMKESSHLVLILSRYMECYYAIAFGAGFSLIFLRILKLLK